jgi:hypothetical protein
MWHAMMCLSSAKRQLILNTRGKQSKKTRNIQRERKAVRNHEIRHYTTLENEAWKYTEKLKCTSTHTQRKMLQIHQ